MTTDADPAFDPRWLEALAALAATPRRAGPRLVDLYLERRLELRLHRRNHLERLEEVRTSGVAARWATDARVELDAVTGCTPRAVADLLGRGITPGDLGRFRPVPPAFLDAPRGWRERCQKLCDHFPPQTDVTLRIMLRRAAVVTAGAWTDVRSPMLVLAQRRGEGEAALLATWDHPEVATWFQTLAEPAPARPVVAESGTTVPVVFTAGTAGALMHELIGHLMEADLIAGQGSALARRRGERVAPESLTVIDDPTVSTLPGAFSADDEGVPAEPRVLVDAGRPRDILADRVHAERLRSAPGRGRRATWSSPPAPRMSNLVILPGRTPPVDLESGLRRGMVVTRLGGAMVEPSTGRVLIRVERAWDLRHGRRRRALAPLALTGTTEAILASLEPCLGVDNLPDWRLGWCVKDGLPLATGASAPTMLVPDLLVL